MQRRNKKSAAEIEAIVEQIRPLLAGRPPHVQGAVLADLVAIHTAGHQVPGDPQATIDVRRRLLKLHFDTVRQLIPVNAKMMGLE